MTKQRVVRFFLARGGGNFVSLPSTRITISMTCHRHDFLKGINPKALAVQATLLYVKPAVGEENFILEYLLNHDLTRIEVT